MDSVCIVGTISAGTIGEGWKDKIQAAHTYAGFLHRELASACKLQDIPAKVLIDVTEGGTGTTFTIQAGDDAKAITQAIVDRTEAQAWEKFITSEQAGYLASN